MSQPNDRPSLPTRPSTLILGLGNILLADEAVGALAVRHLEAATPDASALAFLDGGTLGFTLAIPIAEHARLIVIDAASMGDPPGSIRVFEGESMDRQLSGYASSIHEVSLADVLDIVRLTDSLPARRALIGIEPELIAWGDGLTPAVEAALPQVLERVRALLDRWDREDGAAG